MSFNRNKAGGHMSVRQGKKVIIHFRNGETKVKKFREKKGRFIHFFDGTKIPTSEIITLTIVKGVNHESEV